MSNLLQLDLENRLIVPNDITLNINKNNNQLKANIEKAAEKHKK